MYIYVYINIYMYIYTAEPAHVWCPGLVAACRKQIHDGCARLARAVARGASNLQIPHWPRAPRAAVQQYYGFAIRRSLPPHAYRMPIGALDFHRLGFGARAAQAQQQRPRARRRAHRGGA